MSSQSGPVQEILTGQTSTNTTQNDNDTTPISPATSPASSRRTSFQSHARTMSYATESSATTAPRSNRFSMSFPVQPAGTMSPIRASQSPVREATPALAEAASILPSDTNFLTAIAAQERRVLELREELGRAEADLNKLKRQWAQHEAQKKRDDARSLTKLQPLQTSLPDAEAEDDVDGSSAWMQQEMERRKAMMGGTRSSTRTVFSGSKHTRALSLLSPMGRPATSVLTSQRPEHPPRKESLSGNARDSLEEEAPRSKPILSSSTTPDLTVDSSKAYERIAELADAGLDREMLMQASKKVATGLRDGIWTFLEDLRQATVGEEAAAPDPPRRQASIQTLRSARKQTSKASLRPSSRGSSTSKTSTETKKASPTRAKSKSVGMPWGSAPALADPLFWSEHNIIPPQMSNTPVKKAATKSKHVKSPSKTTSVGSTDNESWDVWDESSPQASRSSSTGSAPTTVPSTTSRTNSPRTSAEAQFDPNETIKPGANRNSNGSASKKDPIPWPALSSLGPKALRRTASHLMSEWERSLTPGPSKEHKDGDDYLGLGSEAAAAEVRSSRKDD